MKDEMASFWAFFASYIFGINYKIDPKKKIVSVLKWGTI